jgi:hypothetical protein
VFDNEGMLAPPYQAPLEEPPPPPVDELDATIPPVEQPDASMLPLDPPDAAGPKVHDAEVPSSPCGSDCPEGACSDAGVCETGPTPLGRFVVRSIEVEVPRGRSLLADTCFDDDSDCNDVSPFDLCPCPPDPQVAIWVDGEKAGYVPVASDSERASWDGLSIELVLNEGSTILLDVLDNDESTPEAPEPFEVIFECELTASHALLASGRLLCEDEGIFPPGPRRRVLAEVEALEE